MDTAPPELLDLIPTRYIDYSNLKSTQNAVVGEIVTIKGKISSLKNIYTRRGLRMQIGAVEDDKGKITVVWFNQPFLIKALYPGREVALSGKVSSFSGRVALVSPEYEILTNLHGTVHTGKLVPVYPETKYVSSKKIRTQLRKTFDTQIDKVQEFLPSSDLKEFNLIGIKKAYKSVHFPTSLKEALEGKRRLAFNELLLLNLRSEKRKKDWKKQKLAYKLTIDKKAVSEFINSLAFRLTASQKQVLAEALKDIEKPYPMNRLLQGDVGSGKTVVAAILAFVGFLNGYQTIIMAPTQILAQQHYRTLTKLFEKYKIRISLITSDTKSKALGRSDIFVGTHALIHKKVEFDRICLVVIDEQHRFGVEQRSHLIKKSGTPHVLTMTATPIPRTVALTTYGDLDLSVLTELPHGRQKITTWQVSESKRLKAYNWIKTQITKSKNQAFWICPLIDESEKETMKDIKAVTTQFDQLKKSFPKMTLGLLHSRLKSKEKTLVLEKFNRGKLDILVSTPVVEVGIDIPNATIMVIEGSERFGLAQLHQLRGRVGRGSVKSYCLLFGKGGKRLTAMTKIHSGFELAELDLKLRGPGEILGTRQSGFPELKIATWADVVLIAQSKKLAQEIIHKPSKYSLLLKRLNLDTISS